MARGVGGALAEGVEAGWRMGMQADEAAERKKERERLEKRSADELALRRTTEERLAAHEKEAADRQKRLDKSTEAERMYQRLVGEEKNIVEAAKTAQAAGEPVSPELAQRYGSVRTGLQAARQEALNFFSRAQSGQIDPMAENVTPGELYRNVSLATGMKPEELATMKQHTDDIQAGLETNNQGLVLQGVNGLLAPQLRMGIGGESPHGGEITRKEIVRLVPAQDAQGRVYPDKFFPVLRVYVKHPNMKGAPIDDQGSTGYYDAPMTKGRSTDPEDTVPAIDLKRAMDYMGNVGVLANAMAHPDVAAKIEQGRKDAGAEVDEYLRELTNVSRPAKKVRREHVQLGDRVIEREIDMASGKVLSEHELKRGAQPRVFAPGTGAGGAQATLSDKYDTDERYRQQVDYWAQLVADGGTLPPRFAQSGAGKTMFSDIVQRVPELGGDPREMLANAAEVAGERAGARVAGARAASFGLAKEEAYKMADLVVDTSSKVPRTDFVPINRALNAFNTQTGDTKIVQFGGALNSFINAYARAISPTGAPTVSDKDHAREMLEAAQSHSQVKAVIETLKAEMVAAGAAPGAVRQQQREAIRSGRGRSADQPIAGGATTGPKSFASGAEAEAAAKAGKIKIGDRITVGGKSGTWQ